MPPEGFAVIGDPIDHSLSPVMQNAALVAAGLDRRYEAIRVPGPELEARVPQLVAELAGFNVTVPHKVAIMALLDELDTLAAAVGAVNTVVIQASVATGFNTDVEGFRRALDISGVAIAGRRVVVLGAGGVARAVAVALANTADVTVVSRDAERARVVASLASGYGIARSEPAAGQAVARADIVVNATSLGLGELAAENPLCSYPSLKDSACLFDLIYGCLTPFQKLGHRRGLRVLDGLEMLVQQGAASFRLFTGREPDMGVMRAACVATETRMNAVGAGT